MYLPATYNQAKQEINAITSEGLDDVWVDFDFDRLSDFDEEEEENDAVGKMLSMFSLTGQEIKFGMRAFLDSQSKYGDQLLQKWVF